jgi:hypothetical protein
MRGTLSAVPPGDGRPIWLLSVNRLALTTKAASGTGRLPGLAVLKDGAAISRSIAGRSSQAAATPLH